MIKKIAFILYIIVTLVLITATVIEKFEGMDYIQESVYGAPWFYLLWGITTLFAIIYILQKRLYRELSSFFIHISFVIILIGAIITAYTAEQGAIYLEYNQTKSCYLDKDNREIDLPFEITLYDFEIDYYAGTEAAADYISHISIEGEDGTNEQCTISMNRIGRYDGYRFYQSEYDKWGSMLSVSRDIYGIPITYTGYVLLTISLILMLISPKGALRRIVKSSLFKGGSLTILLLLCSYRVEASNQTYLPKTLSSEQIESLSDIQVVYNERVMPITTLAHDFTLKIVGDTQYRGYSSEQFFWGWLLFPSQWEREPLFNVPLSPKQEFLALKERSCYADFFTEKGVYKLNHYIRNTEAETQPTLLKSLKRLNESIQLTAMLRSGAMMRIFPNSDSAGKITWYSPVSELPSEMDRGQILFIENCFKMLLESLASENINEFKALASKIVEYQKRYGGDSLINHQRVKAEQWYYSIPLTKILYRIDLIIGIISLIIVIVTKRATVVQISTTLLKFGIIFTTLSLTIYIGVKWYIIGRVPLINGYDTMLFMGWITSLISLLFSRNSPLFISLGTIMAGITMLVATIGGMNPQITPLIPVLNSPFLTSHVCLIMLSYSLFAFTFINGILSITAARGDKKFQLRLTLYSRIFLLLAITALAIGIFIGAIWANVSWGRYWGWDPKEVWALITMMIYALPLHTRSIAIFRNSRVFHIYMIVAFLSVLMTYFGVNYLLGGIHSYAN